MKHVLLTALGASVLATSALAEDVVLTLWAAQGVDGPEGRFATEFSEMDNGITMDIRQVKFDDLVTETLKAFATRSNPDLIALDNPDHAAFASRGVFLNLDEYIAASDQIDLDQYFEGARSSLTWDGETFGIPRASNTIALYYNRDLFEAAGLDPDDPPETWDELYEAAKALTDPENEVYGIAFSAKASEEGTFQFLPWVQMTGGGYENVNGEGAVRALELWKRFFDERLTSPDTLTRGQWDSTGTFNGGNAAMAISGPWELTRMSEDAAFDWDVTPLPVPEEGTAPVSALGDFNLAIFANSEHPDEAFRFLEYYDSQMHRLWPEFTRMPPRSDVELAETGDPRIDAATEVFVEQLEYSRNRGPHPEWPKISSAIQTAIQSALTGQQSPEDALNAAQERIDSVLN